MNTSSEIIDNVKSKVEICIQKYMSLEETMTYLQNNHQISYNLTKTIWEQLEKESPDFFKHYYLKCEVANHIKMFNDSLAKQVTLMLEHGYLNMCNAPSCTPQQSPSSLAVPDTNGSSVIKQLQISNDVQNQENHNQFSIYDDLADIKTPPQDFYSSKFTWDIGHNGLSLDHMDMDAAAPTLMQSNEELTYLNGQQHNFDYERSMNALQINDEQELNHPNQPYTSVDEQQRQGAILHHHHHEHGLNNTIQSNHKEIHYIEALVMVQLHNIDNGDGTIAAAPNQHDLENNNEVFDRQKSNTRVKQHKEICKH